MGYCIILTTCPDRREADMLACELVNRRLAACVQTSPVTSCYYWDGSACRETEIKLAIKTKTDLYRSVEKFILEHHSYEVPQIIQIPVTDGSQKYLDWIDANTI